MELTAVTLIFWVLIFIGIRDGDFSLRDAALLRAIWIGLFLIVFLGNKSPWYFAVPASLLTIYTSWVVLGPDADFHSGGS